MSYDELIKEYMELLNFSELTEVQKCVIEKEKQNKNLVVQSVTGTGKTYAYLFPIFASLDYDSHDLQYLILAPTRELARQIYAMAKPLSIKYSVDTRLYVGGDDVSKALKRLETSNPQIAIGTIGRIKKFAIDNKLLNVFKVKKIVMDEADMLMDSGFLPLIDEVLSLVKEDTRFEVYSATITEELDHFFKKYLSSPEFLILNRKDLTPLNISHYFLKTKYRDKVELLKEIISSINPYLCLIYCNTQETVKALSQELKDDKRICFIYGDMDSKLRQKTMRDLRNLKYTYVISTDITARGIDITGVSHIINYELPKDIEFYVHRTGRTGRMLKDGISISFYDADDDSYLDRLEEKGLSCEYKDFKNGEIVESKARYERERKDFYNSKINKEAEKTLRHHKTISKKVKPNYKKKFEIERRETKKKIIEKRLYAKGGKKKAKKK